MRKKPETRINDTGKECPDQLPASIRRIFENQPQKDPDEMDTARRGERCGDDGTSARRRRIAADMRRILESCEPKRPCGDSEAEKEAWFQEFLARVRLLAGDTRRLHRG